MSRILILENSNNLEFRTGIYAAFKYISRNGLSQGHMWNLPRRVLG
jgi:hypothetical protein